MSHDLRDKGTGQQHIGLKKYNTKLIFMISLGLALSLSITATAQDDPSMQIDGFEPLADQHINVLNVAGSDVLPHLGWTAGGLLHYAHKPLRIISTQESTSEEEGALLDSQTKLELWGGIGLYEWVDVGLVLPLVYNAGGLTSSAINTSSVDGVALGDIRITPKVRILDARDFAGFGLAAAGTLYIPSGGSSSFTGEGTVRFEPRLIADYTLPFGFRMLANLSYQARAKQQIHNITNDDVFRWSAGFDIPIGVENLKLLSTIFGTVQLSENLDPNNLGEVASDDRGDPIEMILAARYGFPWGLVSTLGGGFGLNRGVGAPQFRVLASVGYHPMDSDSDGDGLMDSVDNCPDSPEDIDNFEDEDGCPDLDNDKDGIVDDDDDCSDQAEDMDGFEDENGCPDPDNDGDGILDDDDTCRDEAEDIDNFEDEDGCPDTDNDGDGILDDDDACRDEAEDIDKFKDDDGCPDPDNDGDGFCDPWVQDQGMSDTITSCQGRDACPEEKEIINGVKDDDGCPDEGESSVVMNEGKIELKKQIFFTSGKSDIRKVSKPVLKQIETVMKTNPQITKILIKGHTDDVGKDAKNLKLSKSRAASVRQNLINRGIDPSRLTSEGYGESVPLVDFKGLKGSKLKQARGQNRRVEILILEINGKPVK